MLSPRGHRAGRATTAGCAPEREATVGKSGGTTAVERKMGREQQLEEEAAQGRK